MIISNGCTFSGLCTTERKKAAPRGAAYFMDTAIKILLLLGQVVSLPQRRVGRGQTGDRDPEG